MNYKRIIIFSLIISLPISIFFVTWGYNTTVSYFEMDKFVKKNKLSKGIRLERIGRYEFISILETIRSSLGLQTQTDLRLFLETKSINELNSHLPKSGFEDKKAFLMVGDEFVEGKARYRGDHYYHWLLPYKSWRFKTSKKNLYKNVRKYNFIIPKSPGALGNQLSYKLAKLLNLLVPDSSIKSLSINGKYNGLKLLVEQIDESFLRNNGRMPNDIYKGDNIGSKKILGLKIPSLFDAPYIWDKAAINNHYPADSRQPLENLFVDLNNRKNFLLDKESFVNNMVLLDLTSSFHHDALHNWILYYDNYYEKFYPIIWDTAGWQQPWVDAKLVNIVHSSRLVESLYNDYDFLIAKYYALYNFFKQKQKIFFDLMDEEIKIIQDKIDLVGYYAASGRFQKPSRIKKSMAKFKNKIKNRFKFVRDSFFGGIDKSDYIYAFNNDGIRLSIAGNKLVNKVYIQLKEKKNIEEVYIKYLQNGMINRVQVPFTILKNNVIFLKVNLLSQANLANRPPIRSIKYDTATYDIEIKAIDKNDIKSVALSLLVNKKNKFNIEQVSAIDAREFNDKKNIIKQKKLQQTETWSGTKNFSGFNIIKNNILIKAGTKIVLAENATLKVLGKVTAIGTKEQPIIFAAKDKTKPWGAFVLKDAKANNSIFKHCVFKDGSGDKGDLYEYTAMLSVHNVQDLLVDNCEFYDSHKTDDMVHVIYSDATFKNTKFESSLSDALDVDISNLVVDNCEFIDSGNDSIDLMTTNAVVINTKFSNSKDKGISIGESSNLLAINNHIQGSEIGMQSKDTSKAYVYNSLFIENKKAIDAYHKNWRYSQGGTIHLDRCVFEKNILNATVGKKSKVVINNSIIDTPDNFDKKSLRKNKLLIQQEKNIIPKLDHPFFEEYTKELKHGQIQYSFFVAGHTYGSPARKNIGLHPPFSRRLINLNENKKIKFGVLTGDIVWLSHEKYWDKVDEQLNQLKIPTYFAPGNHEYLNKKLFISRYAKNNKTYYSFTKNDDLMIVLDPNIDKWNISGNQLFFLKNTLKESDKYKNIFVFFHQILWWDKNNKYKKSHINSRIDRDKEINFWSTIEPLFHNLTNQVYMFAGDTGAFKHHVPHYDVYDNIHFIASGMGGGVNDNYVKVNVYEDKHVYIQLIKLQDNVKENVEKYKVSNE